MPGPKANSVSVYSAAILFQMIRVAGFEHLANVKHDRRAPARWWLVEQFDSLIVVTPGSAQQSRGLLALGVNHRDPAALVEKVLDLALDFPPGPLLLVQFVAVAGALHGSAPVHRGNRAHAAMRMLQQSDNSMKFS
tara:strand:+ start:78777 stop:79184 length:408 start_codon:yes stop_codon:yes gene_type:complete